MGIPVGALPDGSQWTTWAYDVAYATVNTQFTRVPGPFYMLMVYNLGGDNLLNWAGDAEPPFPYPTNNPSGLGYFAYLRDKWDLNGFVAGVIQSSADESTSESLLVPDAFKEFTLANLQNLKTPYGRQYLAWAQDAGDLWGLS